eukprot:scaffold22.g6087.t1
MQRDDGDPQLTFRLAATWAATSLRAVCQNMERWSCPHSVAVLARLVRLNFEDLLRNLATCSATPCVAALRRGSWQPSAVLRLLEASCTALGRLTEAESKHYFDLLSNFTAAWFPLFTLRFCEPELQLLEARPELTARFASRLLDMCAAHLQRAQQPSSLSSNWINTLEMSATVLSHPVVQPAAITECAVRGQRDTLLHDCAVALTALLLAQPPGLQPHEHAAALAAVSAISCFFVTSKLDTCLQDLRGGGSAPTGLLVPAWLQAAEAVARLAGKASACQHSSETGSDAWVEPLQVATAASVGLASQEDGMEALRLACDARVADGALLLALSAAKAAGVAARAASTDPSSVAARLSVDTLASWVLGACHPWREGLLESHVAVLRLRQSARQQGEQEAEEEALRQVRALALRRCAHLDCPTLTGASEADVQSKLCSGCRAVRFCLRACSVAAWPQHRRACRALAAQRAAADAQQQRQEGEE